MSSAFQILATSSQSPRRNRLLTLLLSGLLFEESEVSINTAKLVKWVVWHTVEASEVFMTVTFSTDQFPSATLVGDKEMNEKQNRWSGRTLIYLLEQRVYSSMEGVETVTVNQNYQITN